MFALVREIYKRKKRKREKGEGKRKIKEVNIKEKMKISAEIFSFPYSWSKVCLFSRMINFQMITPQPSY